jgi:protein tyrosine phosphatase
MEFEKAKDGGQVLEGSFLVARINWRKNQNQEVVPQDGNRVKLEGQANDYINATRLESGTEYLDRTWIMSQGPMDSTIEDFWQLIWQQDTRLVVMLTKTFEVVRLMCSQYWPVHIKSKDTYGTFTVELLKEETFARYRVRHLNIKHLGEMRRVTQFHYTSWPLSSQPDSASLLLFRRHIWSHLHSLEISGPPLVHCHDGGGRSGTFLAIEANLTMVETKGEVDSKFLKLKQQVNPYCYCVNKIWIILVLGTVKWLQRQRPQLMSHPGFYRLIYDVLEDHIKCGDTSLELEDMMYEEARNLRQAEFNTLSSLRPQYTIGDCAAGHRHENRDKNRNVLVVPPDEIRPYLTTFQVLTIFFYIRIRSGANTFPMQEIHFSLTRTRRFSYPSGYTFKFT